MIFNQSTRKLMSDTGFIHRLDDSLYVNHPIYLGINDIAENYEEGNESDYLKRLEAELH